MISIVIVNYRTPDDLLRLITSLKAHPPAGAWEALVVDNASGDDSPARLRAAHPDVTLIESPRNTGFAGGVNLGLAAARGEWLLILNPDIEIRPGSVDALRGFMERHPRAGLGAARLVNPDGSLQHTCRTYYTFWTILLRRTFLGRLFPNSRAIREHLMLDYDHATPRGVDWVAGACMMVRRRALEEVGPMDERYFMYFEDVDWCARMHRRGWQVWYVPEAEMVHGYRRASAAGFGRMARTHAGSLIRFWEKYSALLYLARRHRRTIRAGLLMLADLAAMNAAFLLAYSFRQEMATVLAKPLFPLGDYVTFLALTNVVGIGAFAWSGLYREENRGDWIDTLFGAGRALLLTCVLLLATTFILDARYSRVIILGFWPLALLLVTLERRLIYNGLERARRERINVQRMALIGGDSRLDALARALREDPRHGYEPVRHAGVREDEAAELIRWLQDERITDVVVAGEAFGSPTPDAPGAGTAESPGAPARLIGALRDAGLHVHLLNPWGGLPTADIRLSRLADTALVTLAGAEGAPGRRGLRRLFEVGVALTLLIVYLFPALVAWLGLLLTGRRPRWERRPADAGAGLVWTAQGWGQRWLNAWALDRYPTLFDLLSGRLALVAPPEAAVITPAPESGVATPEAHDWSAERDLKILMRDTLGRLRRH